MLAETRPRTQLVACEASRALEQEDHFLLPLSALLQRFLDSVGRLGKDRG